MLFCGQLRHLFGRGGGGGGGGFVGCGCNAVMVVVVVVEWGSDDGGGAGFADVKSIRRKSNGRTRRRCGCLAGIRLVGVFCMVCKD